MVNDKNMLNLEDFKMVTIYLYKEIDGTYTKVLRAETINKYNPNDPLNPLVIGIKETKNIEEFESLEEEFSYPKLKNFFDRVESKLDE